MDFSKAEIVDEDEIPDSMTRKIDYTPLFRKLATLGKGEVLKMPIDKPHKVNNVKRAVEREFTHNKYHVYQRTIDGQLHCCVKNVK